MSLDDYALRVRDYALRVRAIHRHRRMMPIVTQMVFHPCGWTMGLTKRSRAKKKQFWRIWIRVRDAVCEATGFSSLHAGLFTFEDIAAEEHVLGCQCRRCPRTPRR